MYTIVICCRDWMHTVQSLKHSIRLVHVDRRLTKPCWAEHNMLFEFEMKY